MKKVFLLLPAFVLLVVLITTSHAERTKMAVDFNYPGVGFRYMLSNKMGIEFKAQGEIGVTILGARGYYFINRKFGIHPFYGIEVDTIAFKGVSSEGSGTAFAVFIGAESFLSNSLALQLDFGPAMIMLADDSTNISDTGTEIVVNIGLNWYFGGEL